MDNLYLDSGVLWTIALFAAAILITMLVIWFRDYLKTETILREARYRIKPRKIPAFHFIHGFLHRDVPQGHSQPGATSFILI